MESIKGKHILVIGATGGIGSKAVELLKSSGANLFITGRNKESLTAVAQRNGMSDDACFTGDLTRAENVAELKDAFFKKFGQIDVLINASGVGIIKNSDSLTHEDFLTSLMTNLYSPFMIIKAFLPEMKKTGKGLIVHIPGVLGKVPMLGAAAYSASKYGLNGMLQSLRE